MGRWSYYRLCENLCRPLGLAPGGNLGPILRSIWDLELVLSDIPIDAVFGKTLVFGKILRFLGVNWAQKWTKTENFGYVPFVLKYLILKSCSHTVFVSWWTTSGPNFNKFELYLGEKGPRNLQKRPISWLLHHHKNILKFITLEPQMLSWWNLPGLCITIRTFIWKKLGRGQQGVKGRGQKTSEKKPKNPCFGIISWNFQDFIKNVACIINFYAMHHWSEF